MAFNGGMSAPAHRPAVFGGSAHPADPSAPAGTFAPGTKIQVGNHKVVIQKYFSEGGFAHVYLVKMPKPIDGTDIAILKRVAVPDKENLANMRTEVETMKKLKGHRPIVTYYDSHASQLQGGGYEVFLLMEFCNGGGLIDFMNTRLQNRLTEPEILKIFSDVAEGVACMHYLRPPLLHRDLKVENVLISSTGSSKRFKLCDFGSTAPPRPAATTAGECRLIEDDVQKHTTLQYRSPEMVDVYRKLPIDEKSDIWALGVLLYKLCYYTTPFEAQGQLAILNASFKFPHYPPFSDKLKKLIASMLKENPKSRPNIYQALREACLMQGIEVPIQDIYAGRTQSESRRNQQLPSPEAHVASPPTVGAVFSPPAQAQQVIPDVVPMRRGRPTAGGSSHVPKPSPSPMRGTTSDPFAALDSKSPTIQVDDISSRFPSLDQFSLLHDGGKFDFEANSPAKPAPSRDISQRVTEKLADDAFAMPPPAKASTPNAATNAAASAVSRAQKIISKNPELQSAASPQTVYQPTPTRPQASSSYVSQGTMTNPTSPPSSFPAHFNPSPVHRFKPSDHHRSTSLPRNQESKPKPQQYLHPENQSTPTATLPQRPGHTRHASSSRPSLEGGRPTADQLDPITRTKSSNSRPRPASTYLESNMDFLREKEAGGRSSMDMRRTTSKTGEVAVEDQSSDEETNIESNVDFLKAMEDTESSKKDHHHRRSSSSNKHSKRSSLPSLSGTKNLLAGKFGDAFKRFESNTNAPPGPRTPSPLHDLDRRDLTPIAGSEATDGRSDDGYAVEDMEGMAPEQRREAERRRLSMEERRVANAAAEYRRRLAERGPSTAPKSIGGVSRAASIQNKVKNLLDENSQASPKKTAEGYGRFTDPGSPQRLDHSVTSPANPYPRPAVSRKPILPGTPIHPRTMPTTSDLSYPKPRPQPPSSAPPTMSKPSTLSRPNAPPKPTHLNSATTGSGIVRAASPPKRVEARPDMSAQEKEDYLLDFSKRFPSLSGIEMVETDLGRGRDV
ncbi:Protein kinase-like (PK-like) [Glarea lozoyensis ATCC 20868]|uniref:non-specific serine/threonine protein kinase n=1 Tax=Glarea lozoyensis (strain ATCC 20868 / MF5171) TaxID=1116229 RepID=S3DDB3_GLAL2|nr:Protein kinase-like (PK-like) [Glarea lozoyensis ATCC 20868]EPE35094.1 Protein kinase-like (PK-like) [Glarea lozoyensis ATCC 20868]